MRPRLLDLFCGAGGAAMGYHRAGFDVVGVDLRPQPNYPFEFVQADALDYLTRGTLEVDGFDAIHASPPCQAFTAAQSIRGREHEDLLTPCRDLLSCTGLPWVIENVPGAPMRKDLVLCGSMFGLEHRGFGVRRHRWFEFSNATMAPLVSPCWHRLPPAYIYGHGADNKHRDMYGPTSVTDWKHLMDTPWMTRDEISQAIPPAYTEFIGAQLLAHLDCALPVSPQKEQTSSDA